MKEGIHPNYVDSVIRCACGNEVKTRSTTNFGHPFEAVDKNKLQNIFKAALSYLEKTKEHYTGYRIDVISVLGIEQPKIEHLKDISLN